MTWIHCWPAYVTIQDAFFQKICLYIRWLFLLNYDFVYQPLIPISHQRHGMSTRCLLNVRNSETLKRSLIRSMQRRQSLKQISAQPKLSLFGCRCFSGHCGTKHEKNHLWYILLPFIDLGIEWVDVVNSSEDSFSVCGSLPFLWSCCCEWIVRSRKCWVVIIFFLYR